MAASGYINEPANSSSVTPTGHKKPALIAAASIVFSPYSVICVFQMLLKRRKTIDPRPVASIEAHRAANAMCAVLLRLGVGDALVRRCMARAIMSNVEPWGPIVIVRPVESCTAACHHEIKWFYIDAPPGTYWVMLRNTFTPVSHALSTRLAMQDSQRLSLYVYPGEDDVFEREIDVARTALVYE